MCQMSHKEAKANNMGDDYDESKVTDARGRLVGYWRAGPISYIWLLTRGLRGPRGVS